MDEYELTVCTVSFHSRPYLELNWKLTRNLNPNTKFTWIIVENTPFDSNDFLESYLPEFHVFKGYKLDPTKARMHSYHHGIALNKAIRLAKTRYVLVLDPDFYILRKNWIVEIIEYMKTKNLAFFGAPWNPKWFTKYRYFPCVHCMFIDLENVKLDTLDFRPGQNDYALKYHSSVLSKIIKRIRNRIISNLYQRRIIIKAQDAGYDVYHRYFRLKKFRNEVVFPVFKISIEPILNLNNFLNKFLPDRYSFVPKRPGYYSRFGFRELGYTDVEKYGWEEFIWKNKPFGFHLRMFFQRFQQKVFDAENEMTDINRVIFNLAGLKTSSKI